MTRELLKVWKKGENSDLVKPMLRQSFYERYRTRTNFNGLYAAIVHVFIFNANSNRIFIQKRSSSLSESPLKWDKSVGGHILYNETSEQAVRREVSEELNVNPWEIEICSSQINDLNPSHNTTEEEEYTRSKFFLKKLKEEFLFLTKNFDGEKIDIAYKAHTYYGTTWKSQIDVDNPEVEEIKSFDLDELIFEMKNFPEKFTLDLQYLLPRHLPYFHKFLGVDSKKSS